jgi:hypothetical protein
MNFRQQQFRQSVQQLQHLDAAKNQSTLVKTDPTSEPEVVVSTPESVVEPAPVVVETPAIEQPKVEQQHNKLPNLGR